LNELKRHDLCLNTETIMTIQDQIDQAIRACLRANMEPTEVWLGPAEASALAHETKFLSFTPQSAHDSPPTIRDGDKYHGLTIRLMRAPGVRVGSSFTP
jgi:hypothetical protein